MIRIFKNFLMTMMLCLMFVSCTNEEPISFVNISDLLVSSPKVEVYSGETYFGGMTRSSISSEPHKSYKVQDNPLTDNFKEQNPDLYEVMTHAPQPVSDDEWNYVKQYLTDHPNEGGTVCDLTEYFIQWCGKSYVNYGGMKDQNGAEHNVTGSNQMDYIEIDGVHLPDYNGGYGPIIYCENWPLIDPTYHDSYGDMNQIKHDMYRFYYIEYNGEWGLYLCFDYTTQKNSGEYLPGDGIFNDWVLKITPADGVVTPPSIGDDDKNTPETSEPKTPKDEVEVNLHGTDKGGYLESHLSIHVRHAGDVEVFIPVPRTYYCEKDDMAIVEKHLDKFMIHGGPKTTEFNIDGNIVKLNIEFVETGIRIWTDGINEDVINYLNKKYNDGITFEVWNYFNDSIDLDTLKEYLNQATIKFLDGEPDLYVNSFVTDEDCNVSIIEGQDDKYNYEGKFSHECHSNGSDINDIYTHK